MTTPGGTRGAAPVVPLLAVPQIEAGDEPEDLVDLMFVEAFTAGREPCSRSRELNDVPDRERCLPDPAQLPWSSVRETDSDTRVLRLVRGDGWSLRTLRWKRGGNVTVTVTARDAALARAVLASAVRDATPAPPDPDEVPVVFWHSVNQSARRTSRVLQAQSWTSVRENYAERVAAALDPVLALRPGDVTGRLLLLHGPPGTGKSTLLRSLARQWQDWCSAHCVLDPERLFAEPSYLLDVMLGEHDGYDPEEEDEPERPWRLLLLEDCDELIRADAKSATGQGLSRLLNLTDGLLGQGRNVLVAITTNEPLGHLHPAVTRPGRAMATLEVGALPAPEARSWLARAGVVHPVPAEGLTLAELFAAASNSAPARVDAPAPEVGLYL